jgi:hypothetical protein
LVPFNAVASRKTPMENVAELNYKIVRTWSDDQEVLVGACEGVKEARKIIEELSKYRPAITRFCIGILATSGSPNPNSP